MVLLLSQPLPPQQYNLPLPRSPPTGTELEELEEPHPEMQQRDQGENFSFQADIDGFLHVDCTRIPEQGGTFSFQADVGVNPETTTPQVTARQEFARLQMSRQQSEVIVSTEQRKQFGPGG